MQTYLTAVQEYIIYTISRNKDILNHIHANILAKTSTVSF